MAVFNKKKTSVEQLNILVDFVAENKVLLHGKTKPSEADGHIIENLWEDVSGTLNSCGSGPSKTKAQWKKTFIDWKCHTRKKAREMLKMQQLTRGGENDKKVLTATEEKLMALLSWITVKGISDVGEPGLEREDVDEVVTIHELPQPSQSPEPLSPAGICSPMPKRTFLAGGSSARERPIIKKRKIAYKDNSSSLQKAAEAFAEGQNATAEVLNKILALHANATASAEDKKRETDLKEMELKIRFLESKNKEKELALKEIELKLKERELNILELKK